MNLGRAKTILIIAFLGLNLFLGYYLFWPDFGRLTRVAVTAEEKRITEAMLNQNNYVLETSLVRAIQTSDFLTVSPSADFRNDLTDRYKEEGAQVFALDNSTIYRKPDQTVLISPSGLIQIIYDPGRHLADNLYDLEQRELKNKVEQFLTDNNLMPGGMIFDYLEKNEPDSVNLHYYQVLDNVPVYAGQLEVYIELDKIRKIEIYCLELLERSPVREMEVISAAEALTNLVRELGPSIEPRVVRQIDLGFFSGEYDAEKWEIPPVWRVVLDGPQLFYINAFTGNLEQDIIIPEQLP